MKINFVLGLLLLVATVAFAAPPEAIQRVTLDERVVVTAAKPGNATSALELNAVKADFEEGEECVVRSIA